VKKSAGIKERNKEDYGEQLAIQLATPPNSHYFGKNKYHQPFISPARLVMKNFKIVFKWNRVIFLLGNLKGN